MNEKRELSQGESFVKNSFWNVITILFSKLGGMIFVIILARFLLPEKFGTYTLALSVTLFLITLTNIATNQALSKYVSEFIGKKNKNKSISYFHFISKIKLILSIFLVVTLLILAYPLSLYVFKKSELFTPLIFFSFYILFFSFQSLYETLFYIIKDVRFLSVKECLLQSSKIILCIILFLIISPSISLAIITILFSSFLSFLFMRYQIRKTHKFLFENRKSKIDKKRVINFLKSAILSSSYLTLFGYMDIILLGIFVSSSYVGYYSSAGIIAGGFFGLISFSNISLPIFAQMNKEKLKEASEKIFKYLSIISIPLIFGVIVLGKYLLRFVYGYEYLEATIPLIITSLLIFETPINDHLKSLLLSREKSGIIAKIMGWTTILNLILSLILIIYLVKISMLWAIIGASIAIVVSRFTVLFCLSTAVKYELNISFSIKKIIKPFVASTIMIIPLLLINSQISDMTYLIGFGEVVLGVLVYLTAMILINGIKKEDFYPIRNLINPQKILLG